MTTTTTTTTHGRSGSAGNNPLQRVKVYRLNEEGKWDDRGTGHVSVELLERPEATLIVIDEEDHETLLLHRISAEDIYRRQEDTIIAWRDPEIGTELALSFQEAMGCSYIWDQICSLQRAVHFPNIGGIDGGHLQNDDVEHSSTSHSNDDGFHGSNGDIKELPQVEISTLPQILKTIMEGCIMDQIQVAELINNEPKFIPKLLDVFKMCEDLENKEGLHLIYKIFKGIILLNNSQLFEVLLGDEYIMDVIGALEYDPDIPFHQKHRVFLKEQVVFKEAIPIKDASLLSKIHQSYRVGYIKDVILPRVLDEGTFATLNSIIHSNNLDVVSALKDDNAFLQDLFAKLKSPSTSNDLKKNLISFLQEFCALCKCLSITQQIHLFRDLMEKGLFDIITSALQSEDKLLRLTGTDILIVILNQDASLLRSFLIQQRGHVLLGLLVKGMSTDFGEDMHSQYLEIIRMILEPYTMATSQNVQKDFITEIFYENYMDQLVDVVACSCSSSGDIRADKTSSAGPELCKNTSRNADLLSNIMDLLCFCVQQQNVRIRYYLLRNNLIEKVLCITRRKEKYLGAAAVRFLRTVIGRADDALNKYIVNHNIFEPVMKAFIANGTRYNLLNSAVLEIVEYIRKENVKCLVEYLTKKFYEQVKHLDCVGTFQALKLKYEQNLEGCITKGASASSHTSQMNNIADHRKRLDERALEKEEEDYFNEDSDDEEDTASARSSRISSDPGHVAIVNGTSTFPTIRSGSISLVDYEDEDDLESPVVESASKGTENAAKPMNSHSSLAEDSLGPESVSPKRKFVDDSNDGENDNSKRRMASSCNLNEFGVLQETQVVDVQQSELKGSIISQTFDKRGIRSSAENSAAVSISNSDRDPGPVPTVDSNGHDIQLSKNKDCIENRTSSLDSEDSGAAKLRCPLKRRNSEGRISNASGPQSPDTYIVG